MSERCPHCGGKLGEDEVFSWGGWTLDERGQLLTGEGVRVQLTTRWSTILGFILRAKGRTVTKEQIYAAVYSLDGDVDDKTLNMLICHTRRRLRAAGVGMAIRTVWGQGLAMRTFEEAKSAPKKTRGGRYGPAGIYT